jgi:protocatechuate 3,4-dioxygenase beta subunit
MSSSFLEFTGAPFEVQPGATYQSEDLVLRLGAMVEGVVVDPSGNGVEGAVVAPREEGEPEFSLTKTAKTDRRGRFALKGMNPGVVALQAKSSHHVEAVLENVEIREGEITPVTLRLQRGQRLAGRVSDDAGSPVSSALVVAREFVTSMKEHRQQTDAEGRFAFENLLSEDTVEISVSHKDYSPYNNQRVPISGEVLEIELEPLGSLAGVVVDVDGTPLGTFSVQPHQVGEAGPNRVRLSSQTFSTDDGRFTFPGVPGGLYEVAVSAEGFSSVSLREVSVTNGELTDLGRIALQDGGIVDGVVVDGATGQPVSGARVRVTNGPSAFLQRGGAQSKLITDSLGAFTFRGLKDSDNITLRVEHDDYMTQDVNRISTADATTSRGLEIVLGVGAEISGVVVDSAGTPKRAHQVFLSAQGGLRGRSGANKTGRTDRSGRFTFASIQPGTYRVTAKALRAGASLNTAEVEVGGGEAVEVNLQVD